MSVAFRIEEHPIVFLRPRLDKPYSWAGHIPFAYLVVELSRPRRLVELGTHSGNSYLAFCQAVAELGIETECVAVDSWKGDEHAQRYGEAVYRELEAYHDPRYGTFSRLHRSYFDDAAAEFTEGSIDLLHIDGLHSYEAVRHDFETWLPKLSERALVLFHDTAVQERGFGVGKYFQELREHYPGLAFEHSNGLGVLVVGNEPPPAFQRFMQAFNAEPATMQRFFSAIAPDVEQGVYAGADLASSTIECRLYFRSATEGYSEERSVSYAHSVAVGLAQLHFSLPTGAHPDYLRVDPAQLPGVYGVARVLLLGESNRVLQEVDDASKYVTAINGDVLPARAPSWVRWVELGCDPFAELRVAELIAESPEPVVAVQVTLNYEVVLTDAAALKATAALSAINSEGRERSLQIGHILGVVQDESGRALQAIAEVAGQVQLMEGQLMGVVQDGSGRALQAIAEVAGQVQLMEGHLFGVVQGGSDRAVHAIANFGEQIQILEGHSTRLETQLHALNANVEALQPSIVGEIQAIRASLDPELQELRAALGEQIQLLHTEFRRQSDDNVNQIHGNQQQLQSSVESIRLDLVAQAILQAKEQQATTSELVASMKQMEAAQSVVVRWAERRSLSYWWRRLWRR